MLQVLIDNQIAGAGAGQNWEKLKTVICHIDLNTHGLMELTCWQTLPKGETSAAAEKRKKRRDWQESAGGRKRGLNGVKAFLPPALDQT